ncbi:uncharacterized protein LOC127854847 [Dreissena polymorpha]|uniref:Transmembrane protein 177 n=1 Tax=Dreissena polymorpha TaxID=45954 RepID=A0A9D4C8T3_DREPO|nr:uncharacterized protein LOC127854847 [Dreissena polymorpha]KAH3719592.1 hypothetical protein DPMN_062443 [Dreissena polymorpha]
MIGQLSRAQRNLLISGGLMAGWVAGTLVPNTAGVKWLRDLVAANIGLFKEIRLEPRTHELLQEVIADINASRSTPVQSDKLDFRLTNRLYPNYNFKGCSKLTGAIIDLPIGMRQNARDVFYIHCMLEIKDHLIHTSLLERDEKKFLLAEAILYTEDNYILFRCLFGALLVATVSGIVHYIGAFAAKQLAMFSDVGPLIFSPDAIRAGLFRKERWSIHMLRAVHYLSVMSVVCTGVCVYWLGRGMYATRQEEKVVEQVTRLGPAYVKGGADYYNKRILTNKIRREVLNEMLLFDRDGNYSPERLGNRYFPKTLPLTVKWQMYLDKLKQLNAAEAKTWS